MLCQHKDHWSDRFSMRSCPKRAYILEFFMPFRLSSLSMAEAPVAVLPYALEAFAWLRYLLRVTFYSVGRFQSRFHGGYHSPFHFHSVCPDVCRFKLFHSVRRHFWRESLSLVSWCLSYFALHFVFIACVAYKFFFSWRVAFRLFLRRVSPSS